MCTLAAALRRSRWYCELGKLVSTHGRRISVCLRWYTSPENTTPIIDFRVLMPTRLPAQIDFNFKIWLPSLSSVIFTRGHCCACYAVYNITIALLSIVPNPLWLCPVGWAVREVCCLQKGETARSLWHTLRKSQDVLMKHACIGRSTPIRWRCQTK